LTERELVFHGGTANAYPFAQRCAAAVAGGFGSITAFPFDCDDRGPRGLREDADRHGLPIRLLDAFGGWLPKGWDYPPGTDMALVERLGTPVDEFIALAEALGADTLLGFEVFGVEYPHDALVEAFADVCDRAAEHGMQMALEFVPWGSIPDLATAWPIVKDAGRPNGGLLLDTWHYFTGTPDAELLDAVPGSTFLHTQTNDGLLERRAATLREEGRRYRLLPGDGEWDVAGVIDTLAAKPEIGLFGVETFNDELMQLPAEEIGRRAGDALRRMLV
jgi:sugar phosphate isomerase/epimerase